LEGAHAAHVALAPGADALDGPAAFGADEAVELVALEVLLLPHPVAPGLEVLEPAVVAAHLAAVHPERRAGRGAQHGAVVRDEDEGASNLGEARLQPLDGRHVEVVGGLVEEEEVGVLRHEASERGAAALAARGGRGLAGGVEAQALGGHGHAPLLAGRQRAPRVVAQGGIAREVGVLLHVAHARGGARA
jgi:hypothetical protein